MYIPKVEEWYDGEIFKLANGATVWAVSLPEAKRFAVSCLVKAGSDQDPKGYEGCAHAFEHMPFRGAGRFRTKRQLLSKIENLDGKVGANTTHERTFFYAYTDPALMSHALEVVTSMVFEPHFNTIAIELETIVQEFHQSRTNPDRRAFETFMHHLNPGHPMSLPVIGLPDSIRRLTETTLREFHQEWYRPANMIFTLVGPGSTTAMIEAIMPYLEKQQSGVVQAPVKPATTACSNHQRVTWNLQPSRVMSAGVFPHTPMNALLNDLRSKLLITGMTSPMFLQLRERRGYCYSWTDGPFTYGEYGVEMFATQLWLEREAEFWSDYSKVCSTQSMTTARHQTMRRYIRACAEHAQIDEMAIAEKAAVQLWHFGQVVLRNDKLRQKLSLPLEQIHDFHECYLSPDKCFYLTIEPQS